jgi:phage terminase small subunit
MPVLPNAKHERFAQELAKGKTQAEAYQAAGYKPSEPNASRLKSNDKVAARVAELQERGAIRAEVTVASIIAELEEAREVARQGAQPGPMVSASMGKAKVAGILVDRTEHTGKDGGPIQTEEVSALDEIHRRIAGLAARASKGGDTSKLN